MSSCIQKKKRGEEKKMFACKNCGGNVKYDINSGQLACEYCHSLLDPYAYENKTSDAEMQKDFEATIFTCPQCGGEILSTDETVAGFCSFCGASTVLFQRMEKRQRPHYIIPFMVTKDKCKQLYSSMMAKAIFAPKELKDPAHIDSFRGIYMPYWVYHVSQKGPIRLKGTKTTRRGDYTYTDHYILEGNNDTYYKGVSFDASSSFDDNISQALAPYDVKGMKPFAPSFFSGFYADVADIDENLYSQDAHIYGYDQTIKNVGKTPAFTGYSIEKTNTNAATFNSKIEEADYSMFPVWFMSYRNKDRVSYATVNGQTGKVVADIPISISKFMLGSFLVAIPIFILLCLLTTLTPSMSLLIVGIISAITNICFSGELAKIAIRETLNDDKGKLSKIYPDRLGQINSLSAIKYSKGIEKKSHTSVLSSIIAIIYGIVLFILIFFGSGFSETGIVSIPQIVWGVVGLLSLIFCARAFSQYDKIEGHKGLFGLVFNIIALLLSSAVVFINPILDMWFYFAQILLLISTFAILADTLQAYNLLSTRRLPQFDHKGGDDRA